MSAQGEAASRLTKLGRYELITRIGQGGMADVQLALQRGPAGFEKLVVVKLVHDALASQKPFVDMLLDEARVAALVKHPNVVDIYDLGQAGGRYFIAMEYLEGEPLLAVLRAGREGKRLDPLSTARVIADTAEGLDAAHELRSMSGEALELVHHDISLGNIVVLYNGQVKLVDFGVAKASQSAAPKTKVQGKFSYMAPEKLRGSSGDRRSDLFSLGCVMWEALTLKRLFRGGNDSETMKQVLEMAIQPPSKVNGDVAADFDPIVMRALDRNPANRHMTAKELAVEIEELLRKRGYGAKNDRVARYMQETFKTHIEARKKVVQEVVSKGSASAEMIDAAFRDPVFANGSPLTPTANIEFAPPRALPPPFPQAVPTVTDPVADSSSRTEIGKPPWEVLTDTQMSQLSTHVVDPTKIDEHPPFPVATVGDRARAAAGRAKDATMVIARRARELAVDVAHDRKKLAIIGIAGGVFLVIMIGAILFSGGGDAASKPAPALAAAPAPDASTAAPPEIAIEPDPVDAAPAAGSATAHRVHDRVVAVEAAPPPPPPVEHHRPHVARVDHDHDRDHDHDHDREPKDKPDPDALFKQGVQAYVKGDSKAALGLLQKARSAAPGNAPTWRVLGQVYEKLGDRGSAKNAFLRYLSLSPTAPDAAQIRERVDRL